MQIFVQTSAGPTITLDVEADDSIESVKTKIQGKTRARANEQRLTRLHSILYDGFSLADNGVDDGATLQVTNASTASHMWVNCIHKTNVVSLLVRPWESVGAMAAKLSVVTGIPNRDISIWHYVDGDGSMQRKASFTMLMDHLNFRTNDRFHILDMRDSYTYVRQTGRDSTIAICSCLDLPIKDIMMSLERKCLIPVRQQKLTFDGTELMSSRSLNDYGIPLGSTLHLEVMPMPSKANWVRERSRSLRSRSSHEGCAMRTLDRRWSHRQSDKCSY